MKRKGIKCNNAKSSSSLCVENEVKENFSQTYFKITMPPSNDLTQLTSQLQTLETNINAKFDELTAQVTLHSSQLKE